jgi:hypothetical protein
MTSQVQTIPYPPAVQSTIVKVCHDSGGLHFHSNATDTDIWNTATACNDPTFADGDVLEARCSFSKANLFGSRRGIELHSCCGCLMLADVGFNRLHAFLGEVFILFFWRVPP